MVNIIMLSVEQHLFFYLASVRINNIIFSIEQLLLICLATVRVNIITFWWNNISPSD
jgi:hypothetical protein